MNKANDEYLVKTFPNLYRNRYGDMRETCMCWGFECQDNGWFELIKDLSSKIETEILKLPPEERANYCALQVKEKYGTLSFSMTVYTDEIWNHIREAEEKSAKICEICGAKGKFRGRGWYYTACRKHTEYYDLTWWEKIGVKLGVIACKKDKE